MDETSPLPERVLQGLLDCLGGRARGLSVGVDRTRQDLAGYAITPFGLVLGPKRHAMLAAALRADGAESAVTAMAAHALAHLRFSTPFNDVGNLKELSTALISLLEDERVERRLGDEMMGLRPLLERQIDADEAAALVGADGALARITCSLNRRRNLYGDLLCEKALVALDNLAGATTTFEQVRAAGSVLANDLGQLRYRFDRSTHVFWPTYRDDNSFLWSDRRAVDEIHEAVTSQSMARQSAPQAPSAEDERRFLYDEWNETEGRYLGGHVTVLESMPAAGAVRIGQVRASATAVEQSRRSERHRRGRRRYFSEAGETIAMDRAIARSVDLACGLAPDERLYEVRLRYRTHFGVLLLLDASESANDRIAGTFTSVLDHERKAVLALANLLASEATPFGVYSFQSDSRERVTIRAHKTLAHRWHATVAEDIRAIRAHKSTRMGAAIRHMATAARHATENSVVVLVTDGEPFDVDVADQAYLVEDARRATHELRAQGIGVLCLKIGTAGKEACERVFGASAIMHCEADRLQPSLIGLVRSIRTELA